MKKLPGSDPRKVAIARLIWEQTAADMAWLAAHLHLRSAANASQPMPASKSAVTANNRPNCQKPCNDGCSSQKMLPAPYFPYFRVLTVPGAAGVKANS